MRQSQLKHFIRYKSLYNLFMNQLFIYFQLIIVIKIIKMRKYYQALLLVTAVISVISLLIYRHEYNRLRYVLEVFNYFGNPGQKLSSNCSELLRNKKLDLHLDEPHSSWQRLTSDLFVFSAYDVDDGRVEGIGYGRVANFQRFTCHVQFDDQLHQSTGQLSVEAIKVSFFP